MTDTNGRQGCIGTHGRRGPEPYQTAYLFGGGGLAVNAVNQLFDLDIQYSVVVDSNEAKSSIDHVGRVDVHLAEVMDLADYAVSIVRTNIDMLTMPPLRLLP